MGVYVIKYFIRALMGDKERRRLRVIRRGGLGQEELNNETKEGGEYFQQILLVHTFEQNALCDCESKKDSSSEG